jgi:hypothetical protein
MVRVASVCLLWRQLLEKPEDYEAHAIDCLALAQGAIKFPDDKATLLEMAKAWLKLAQHVRETEKEKVCLVRSHRTGPSADTRKAA